MTTPGAPKLQRSLGLFACTLMGVGVILGAGIYALVGKAALLGGNAVWLSFLGAAVFAALTGLSYAELSSFIPRAGGEYHYVRRAFGELPAFVVSWLMLGGIAVVTCAVALGFAGYFSALVGGTALVPVAIGVTLATTAILVYGIRQSVWFAGICTAVEVIGLLVVIVLGVPHLGEVDLLEASQGTGGLIAAAALIFFAYIGFEEIVQLSEETKDPTKNIPRAVLLSIAITTVFYVLVAIAAVSIVGWERLGSSDSPLADVVAETVGPRTSVGMAVIALFSTANTVLVMLMSASRLMWGIADDGALPAVLARVHRRRQTPWVSTVVLCGVMVVILVSLKRIDVVASVGNFALFAAFIVINAVVIVLRFREPDTPRPFRIPGSVGRVPVIPLIAIAGALVMMVRIGALGAMLGAGLVLSGLVVRALTVRRAA